MSSRPHWSYSSVSQYLRCPLQFYFQRVLRLPYTKSGSGLVLGSAVHAALAEYHRRLKQQRGFTADTILRVFHEQWTDRESSDEIIYREGESRNDSIGQGVALIEIYLEEPPPTGIVAIEHEIVAPLINSQGEYLETPLVAIIDLLVRVDDHLKVNEFKTSGRAYSESEIGTSLQPTCYVHAVNEAFGFHATVEYTVLIKTKKPKVQRLVTCRYSDDFGRLGDLVQTVEKAVQHEIFYPVESPLNCSTCAYREECRAWGKSTRAESPLLHIEDGKEALTCSSS
jgi:putative RecB family exonuclease